jgi:hypothetical protein
MTPVLIYTDTEKIAQDKALLNRHLTVLQNAYNAFKAVGITPTLDELNSLLMQALRGFDFPNNVQQYAIDKLMAMAGAYAYNSVPLNQQALRAQIVQPDLTTVNATLLAIRNVPSDAATGVGIRIDLLVLASDVISKVSDSDTQIETLYTYYTKTDASAQLATDLQAVADTINTFASTHTAIAANPFTGGGISTFSKSNVPGLSWWGNAYHVSLAFIRNFEAKQAA